MPHNWLAVVQLLTADRRIPAAKLSRTGDLHSGTTMQLGVLDILVLFIIIFWIRRIIQYRGRNLASLPLPPGPKGLPLFGNVFNFPKTGAWTTAARWGQTYGMYQYGSNLMKVITVLSYRRSFVLAGSRTPAYHRKFL